jgi:FtsP/CotA-like multicopper oxidase with cupredoxin domain
MTDEGTSIHWHGLLQKKTPWMDGVPSIHQCRIAPGKTFTYRFRADQVGTSWWYVVKRHVTSFLSLFWAFASNVTLPQ